MLVRKRNTTITLCRWGCTKYITFKIEYILYLYQAKFYSTVPKYILVFSHTFTAEYSIIIGIVSQTFAKKIHCYLLLYVVDSSSML